MSQTMTRWWRKTDYCTFFPDVIFGISISHLCYDHDFAYIAGGWRLKIRSDWELTKGVWNVAGRADRKWQEAVIKTCAVAMGAAVSTFGWIFWLVERGKEVFGNAA